MNFITRRLVLLLIIMLLSVSGIRAAWFSNVPVHLRQPDHSVVSCLVTGDEFYHWFHDEAGFTLLTDENGYYCYAVRSNGHLIAGKYRFGTVVPADYGLQPWLMIPESDYQVQRTSAGVQGDIPSTAPASGILNNLVIYIRFADDAEFTTSRQSFDNLFNASTDASLKSYFAEVSYNQLNISSGHYPSCTPGMNRSYQNPHPRSYYQAYHPISNPSGYTDEAQRIDREHTLLKNAVEWILINSPVPSTLNLDNDNDGNVDNISFIIKGDNSSWSQLLWSHTWQLFSYDVLINGKKVWGYNLLPENQADVTTLCHEMFHSLGAPDLYHYMANGIQPAGAWDLMESGSGHMLAWMKYKYSGHSWINQIPLISSSGTYSLNPVTAASGQCFKMISPNSGHEIFILEYRQKTGLFESALPGSGLLVYRVDTTLNGNVAGPPDELYIYRPGGTLNNNGSIGNANFSMETGRTSINDGGNPSCFLQDGSPGGIQIYDVGICGQSLNFSVQLNDIAPPANFVATTPQVSAVNLDWDKNPSGDPVLLVYNTSEQFGIPVNGISFAQGEQLPGGGTVLAAGEMDHFLHEGLESQLTTYYKLFSVSGNLQYSNGITASATTSCGSATMPYSVNFNSEVLPDCWSLQHEGNALNDNWDIMPSSNPGFQLRSTFQHASQGLSRAILPAIQTLGLSSIGLTFNHTFDDWTTGATIRIQTSSDGVNWVNEAWSVNSKSNQTTGPVQVSTVIEHNLNSPSTFIAFVVEGDLYSYDYWYIDDIQLVALQVMEVTVAAQPLPEMGGTVEGAGDYLFGEMVGLSAHPAQDWEFAGWMEQGSLVSTLPDFVFSATERSLTAVFSQTEACVGVLIEPPLSGMVTGAGVYTRGSRVELSASPVSGYDFVAWISGDSILSESPEISFVLNSGTQLTASFSPHPITQYRVSLTAGPQEGGIVLGGGVVPDNELHSVFALPYAGWVFDSWREQESVLSVQPGYSLIVDRDYSLHAVFRKLITIEAAAEPEIAGFVSGTGDYLSGDTVTMMAYSNQGWRFKGWSLNGFTLSEDSVFSFPAGIDCKLSADYEQNVGQTDFDQLSFNLYPNPVTEHARIELPAGFCMQTIIVYNINGQEVIQQSKPSSNTLNFTSLTPGTYILKVTGINGDVRKKIFIKSDAGLATF